VHEDQIKLVKLAQTNGGTNGPDVLKRQRTLALNLNFRMLAVQQAVTNSYTSSPLWGEGANGKYPPNVEYSSASMQKKTLGSYRGECLLGGESPGIDGETLSTDQQK
jgi:hypothetical protein